MKVRVKLPEFTWHDKKGYHTVVHVGEVPAEHPAVKAALAKGYLVAVATPSSPNGPTGPARPTRKAKED